MDRETVIALARQAGLKKEDYWVWHIDPLERFAALVAAHEREECAKMAEAFHRSGYDFTGNLELHEAIRSRKC